MERYIGINIDSMFDGMWKFLEINCPTKLFKDRVLHSTLTEAITAALLKGYDTIVTCVY